MSGHAADGAALGELLGLVFHYDAREIISKVGKSCGCSPGIAARGVLRELALLLLDGAAVNSERFSEIITRLKEVDLRRGIVSSDPAGACGAGRGRRVGPGDSVAG